MYLYVYIESKKSERNSNRKKNEIMKVNIRIKRREVDR